MFFLHRALLILHICLLSPLMIWTKQNPCKHKYIYAFSPIYYINLCFLLRVLPSVGIWREIWGFFYVDNITFSFAWCIFNFLSVFNFLWVILCLSPAPFSIGWLSEIVQNNDQFLTSLEFWNRGKSLISASKGISHCSSNSKPRKCNYYKCFFHAWPVVVEPKNCT